MEEYEYPLLLAAEWWQSHRLQQLLKAQDAEPRAQVAIISLLGEIQARESVECLIESLKKDALVREAALALGNFGTDVRPPRLGASVRLAREPATGASCRCSSTAFKGPISI